MIRYRHRRDRTRRLDVSRKRRAVTLRDGRRTCPGRVVRAAAAERPHRSASVPATAGPTLSSTPASRLLRVRHEPHVTPEPCRPHARMPVDRAPSGAVATPRASSRSRRASCSAACGRKDEQQGGPPGGPGAGGPPQALPVTVVDAQPRKIPVTVETVGQSEGSKEIQVRARVSGILLKQRFTEGDRVKAGAVLYQIDPEPYQIALAQAKAALAQAQATSEQAVREQNRLEAARGGAGRERQGLRRRAVDREDVGRAGDGAPGRRAQRRAQPRATRRSPRRSAASPVATSAPRARSSRRAPIRRC